MLNSQPRTTWLRVGKLKCHAPPPPEAADSRVPRKAPVVPRLDTPNFHWWRGKEEGLLASSSLIWMAKKDLILPGNRWLGAQALQLFPCSSSYHGNNWNTGLTRPRPQGALEIVIECVIAFHIY